jgi:hypothetical protein
MDNFFSSDNGQEEEEHKLEESICRDLIGKQNKKPYVYYCTGGSKSREYEF